MGCGRKQKESGGPGSPASLQAATRAQRRASLRTGLLGSPWVRYGALASVAAIPALIWHSLSVPQDSWREPALAFHGPLALVLGTLVLTVVLILWVRMLHSGSDRDKAGRSDPGMLSGSAFSQAAAMPEIADRQRWVGGTVSATAGNKPRVLVVDDDPINRMILRKQLMRLNIEPVSAADGMEALETVRQGPWSLVLMDGEMPRLNGPETALELRLTELLPANVPIVGITTNDTPEFREQCLRAGMQACYHKPVRRFVIEKLVDVYVWQRLAETPSNILPRSLRE